MERAQLHAFMAAQRYGVVSSIGPGGTPQSAAVGIATTPELDVVFDTVRSSRKCANLRQRPACSLVLWSGERTLQLEGVAEEPTGAELERCREAYFAAWPDGRDRLAWPGITHFVIRPRWIRYSDFDRDPPLIEEIAPGARPLLP